MTETGDPRAVPPIQLSVLIACLNAERTVGAQLEALASQDCPVPWEVIVCDNGSVDGTAAVVERYRERLPVHVVDASARRGPGAARNIGARAARGAWLAFCDADDVVAQDWLTTLCAALGAHVFVAGRFEGERLNGARARRARPLDQQAGLQRGPDGGLPHAGAGNMGIHREVFQGVGGFDPDVDCLEDTDLCWRVQRTGVPLEFVPGLIVHVRLRSTLGGMFRQGYAYGRAHAVLDARHAT
ncbi:MAG: glycosyltransferase, partial [Kineosporiaceae bacterium]